MELNELPIKHYPGSLEVLTVELGQLPASEINIVFGRLLKVRNHGVIKICFQIRSNSTIVCPSVDYPGQLQYDGFAHSKVTTIRNLCAIRI